MYLDGRQKNERADKKGERRETAVVGTKNREAGTIGAVPAPEATAARPLVFVGPNADPGAGKFTYENRAYNYLENRHLVPPRRRRISFDGGPA